MKIFWKHLSFVLLIVSMMFSGQRDNNKPVLALESTTQIYIHYYRFQADYDNWNVWAWQNEPESKEGSSFQFNIDDTSEEYNFDGRLAKIPLTGNYASTTRLGLIVRRGEWLEKDVENDRFVDIPSEAVQGIVHVYIVQGEVNIGIGIDDPNGPSKEPKFTQAFFATLSTISFRTTQEIISNTIRVEADDDIQAIENVSLSTNGLSGTITLADEVNFTKTYMVFGSMLNLSNQSFEARFIVTYDGIYDSPAFEENFYYEGDDLGAKVFNDGGVKTSFRLWAPVSTAVTLNLYSSGTPFTTRYASLDETATNEKDTFVMNRDVKGTFFIQFNENLHGTYYTYSVTNGNVTHEVVDPYANSTGINGIRGMVVDFDSINQQLSDFSYDNRADVIENSTDAIIYELHVRDLTTHPSWNGSEENRSKFLGLTEKGTSYEGVSTGFDHIKELGVTHVQLIPIYDFGVVDETRLNDPDYNAFNWGYMPLHFNAPEGSYSSNPFDGESRIRELKQMTTEFNNEGIRVIMDVVYNHTGLTADSNFHLIVPNYYHRLNTNGSFSNGSGTGNETASERVMMRKFMVDSMKMWSREYNLGGFRFDLMELHDLETMIEIDQAMKDLDEKTLVFGEPWKGGSSPLNANEAVGKNNLTLAGGVGAFNDDFRDAVKGSVFQRSAGGYLQGVHNLQNFRRIQYGLVGGVPFEGINASDTSTNKAAWHGDPSKTINYVTAHDNNTLHDKLHLTIEANPKLSLSVLPKMQKQANLMVLTAQGVPFLHAGDEILRSKPLPNGGFDHNSYQSPDSVNQIDWTTKTRSIETNMNAYYRGFIEFRKAHAAFRLNETTAIQNALTFDNSLYQNGIIQYTIQHQNHRYRIVHNASASRFVLPSSNVGYDVFIDGDRASATSLYSVKAGLSIVIPANTSMVLRENTSIPQASFFEVLGNVLDVETWIIPTLITVPVLGIGATIAYFFLVKNKKIKLSK